MDMPVIVRTYFDADRRNDADTLTKLFSADAVVKDEGARHKGLNAIRSWWVAAKERYQHVAEPIETTVADDQVSVRAQVSGKFPNSPTTLVFSFTTRDDKITVLEVK